MKRPAWQTVIGAAVDIALAGLATYALGRGWLTEIGYVTMLLAVAATWAHIRNGNVPPHGFVLFVASGVLGAHYTMGRT